MKTFDIGKKIVSNGSANGGLAPCTRATAFDPAPSGPIHRAAPPCQWLFALPVLPCQLPCAALADWHFQPAAVGGVCYPDSSTLKSRGLNAGETSLPVF